MGFELRSDSKLKKLARAKERLARAKERLPRAKKREQLSKKTWGAWNPELKNKW